MNNKILLCLLLNIVHKFHTFQCYEISYYNINQNVMTSNRLQFSYNGKEKVM